MKNEAVEIRNLKRLARRSPIDEALLVIEELVEYRSPRSVRALAALMKLADGRGDAAMYALIDIGVDAEEVMLACLESEDDDQAWRAQQVLSAVSGADVAA